MTCSYRAPPGFPQVRWRARTGLLGLGLGKSLLPFGAVGDQRFLPDVSRYVVAARLDSPVKLCAATHRFAVAFLHIELTEAVTLFRRFPARLTCCASRSDGTLQQAEERKAKVGELEHR